MGVKCLAQEHNAVPQPGLEPGPSDPESSALTIRPPRHPQLIIIIYYAVQGGSQFLTRLAHLTRGILVSGIEAMSKASILCPSVSFGDLGDLGEPVHCLAELSNNTHNSFLSSSLKWSCIVCNKNVTCLKHEILE